MCILYGDRKGKGRERGSRRRRIGERVGRSEWKGEVECEGEEWREIARESVAGISNFL